MAPSSEYDLGEGVGQYVTQRISGNSIILPAPEVFEYYFFQKLFQKRDFQF